ncbi:hypothetical protein HanXRQr2_Chr12g0524501 [Helianthus annuus]|uniref:Uncharacterized protein n=1 Tax=Helianthus annuus TaxID=4232 RepID=A0A9K3HEI6_HELAN|nr:hypothetical protein HanXRQr2_Chr12g0524501 [Helianthus annuus]
MMIALILLPMNSIRIDVTLFTLSILQITKASEVVPISLYLNGTLFQVPKFNFSNPNFPNPLPDSSPNSPSTLNPLIIEEIPFLSARFSFSLMLQEIFEHPLRELSKDGLKNRLLLNLWCERKGKLVSAGKDTSFAIFLLGICEVIRGVLTVFMWVCEEEEVKMKKVCFRGGNGATSELVCGSGLIGVFVSYKSHQ